MCISKLEFPILWKVACTNHILKVAKSQANDDFRSFSIFFCVKSSLRNTVSTRNGRFSQGSCCTSTKFKSITEWPFHPKYFAWNKHWIIRAANRGEVTIALLAEVSKAFDTVAYELALCKLHKLEFSKSSLHCSVTFDWSNALRPNQRSIAYLNA